MKKNKSVKRKWILFAVAILSVVVIFVIPQWLHWENTALELHSYTIESAELPTAFDGYRIVHISDLHNAEMGTDNERLLRMIAEAEPDMIAITGDLIDRRTPNVEIALHFADRHCSSALECA